MNWQPTNELRWVVRHYSVPYKDTWNIRFDECGNVETHRKWSVPVLQQKWLCRDDGAVDWRDVPVEKEA